MKDIPCLWIGRINIIKMTVIPKAIYKIQCNSYLITNCIFHRTKTKILKFAWRYKRPLIAKQFWERKMELEESSSLTSDYKSYSHQSSKVSWNRIESPEINPCTCGQLIHDKGGKTKESWKDSLFNKWCWENWTATCKKMKLGHSFKPH